MTVKRQIKSGQIKARTSGSCLLERKLKSLKSGKVVQVVIADEVVDLRGVDEEQARPLEKGSELFVWKVVTNSLPMGKHKLFVRRLIGRKLNSLFMWLSPLMVVVTH